MIMHQQNFEQRIASLDQEDKKKIEEIIEGFTGDRKSLIGILQKIQREYGYLSHPALFFLSRKLTIPMSRIWGIVTFYTQFSLTKSGEHTIKVCQGTACHVRHGKEIMDTIQRELDIKPQETTDDGTFTLQVVRCIGSCSLAPVIMIDDKAYGRLTSDKIPAILNNYR